MNIVAKLLSIPLFILVIIATILFSTGNLQASLQISLFAFIVNYSIIFLKSRFVNIFLTIRLIIISLPGFIANLSWAIDSEIYRGHYLAFFIQTPYITTFISIATLYCLLINTFFIFKFGSNSLILNFYKNREFYKNKSIAISFKKARYAALISVVIGIFYSIRNGFRIITQTYANPDFDANFNTPLDSILGVLQNIFVSIVITHLWIGVKDKRANKLYTLCLIGYLFPLLSGARCDYIIGSLTLLICIILNSKIYKKYTERIKGESRFFLPITLIILFTYSLIIILRFISHYRTGYLGYGFFETIKNIINPLDFLTIENEGYKTFNLEALNHVIGSFYSFGYKIFEQGQDFLWGKSYLEYIFRLIPSFLRQGIDLNYQLEWQTAILGNVVTQGGNLEIAEAFYNFGFIGVILVSLINTSLIIFIAKKSSSNLTLMGLFIAISFESFRYIWYQNFALFKLLSVFVIFYPFINYLSPKFIKK